MVFIHPNRLRTFAKHYAFVDLHCWEHKKAFFWVTDEHQSKHHLSSLLFLGIRGNDPVN